MPIARAAAQNDVPHGMPGTPSTGERPVSDIVKIFHLDSDPHATDALAQALDRGGLPFAVERIPDREELIRVLSTQRVDLLFVDYDAPSLGGLSILETVRSLRANVPVILLSSTPGEEAAIGAIKAGASDYIVKTALNRVATYTRRALLEAQERASSEQVAQMMRPGSMPYQRIVDTAREGIWVIDSEGLTIYANRRMAEMLGVPMESMIGRSFFSFMDEEGRAEAATHLEHRKHGVSEQHEFRFVRQSGEPLWAIISTNALVDEKGIFLGALGMVTDITDRRRMEEALKTSEAELRSVFENAAVGICLFDMDGKILKGNPALLRLLGYSPGDAPPQRFGDLIAPDILADGQRIFADLATGRRQNVQVDHRILCKGGRELFANTTLSLVRDEKGAPLFAIAMVQDVTERKRLAEQLAKSERRFRQLIEKASDLTMLLDADGTIRYASPAAASIIGYSRQEIVGQPLLRFLRSEDSESLSALARLRGAATHERREELRILQKNGAECVVEASATGLVDDADAGAVALNLRDITERRVAEALRLEKEEAERASRAKSEFISRMSHELRTPMNAILGFAQVLQRSPDATPKQRERVEYILSAGRHLLHLINEVLDIARIESGKVTVSLEPVCVAEVISEVLELIQPLAVRRNLRVTREDSDALKLSVMADRQQFKQVLLNLLGNAIKYNREGGSVTIACGPGALESLRVRVIDTGVGIAPEKLSDLFIPFERLGADQSGVEGAGLGLALSKRQTELMAGSIGVESTVGVGSTFWIELPTVQPEKARATTALIDLANKTPQRPLGASRKVLYIEDNMSNLRLVADIMDRWPEVRLVSAMTAEEGIALCQEHSFDLILLDLQLPGMGGADALDRFQAMPATKNVPVLVISADATKRQLEHLLAKGARAYLTKPLDIALLIREVEDLLAPRAEGA